LLYWRRDKALHIDLEKSGPPHSDIYWHIGPFDLVSFGDSSTQRVITLLFFIPYYIIPFISYYLMAIGPHSTIRNNPSATPSTPTLIVTLRVPLPTPVTTPRYHTSFQDFLDDIDAEYYNPLPHNRAHV
jgi:hypothetical protein